jgi:hypothetical protein
VKGDSQLIIKQVKGECCCNDPWLVTYLLHAQKLERDFEDLDLHHIPHVENAVPNDLLTKASTWALILDGVFEWWLQQPIAQAANLGEGGKTSTSKLAVPAVLISWSLPMIVGVMGDSVHPST